MVGIIRERSPRFKIFRFEDGEMDAGRAFDSVFECMGEIARMQQLEKRFGEIPSEWAVYDRKKAVLVGKSEAFPAVTAEEFIRENERGRKLKGIMAILLFPVYVLAALVRR